MRCKKTNRVALLVTITLPGEYHATRCQGGVVTRNPMYDPWRTPRYAAWRLRMTWLYIQARLARWGVEVWGMYLVQPHHDGTPHMHVLVYCDAEHEPMARSVIRDFICPIRESLGVHILSIEHPHTYFKKYFKRRSALVSLWAWGLGVSTSPVKFGDWSKAA